MLLEKGFSKNGCHEITQLGKPPVDKRKVKVSKEIPKIGNPVIRKISNWEFPNLGILQFGIYPIGNSQIGEKTNNSKRQRQHLRASLGASFPEQ